MALKTLQFAAIVLVALSLVPGGAHLIELPGKIGLDREQYFTVQQIYRGWALSAIPLLGALLATLALTILSRQQWLPFLFSAASFVFLLVTLVTFFTWIYPINQATDNWTAAPENWQALRTQWEYMHAINAVITLGALVSALLSALTWSSR
jgi:cytochrome bd-type quinol oxidase subunit 2